MAIFELSAESLEEVDLSSGKAEHKFITTPNRIFFGSSRESHKLLLEYLRSSNDANPEAFEEDKRAYENENLEACGAHADTHALAVVDAGLMVVEGIQVPENIFFKGASVDYGSGDRSQTTMVAGMVLNGIWKFHLS